jgi:hypothetical protein
VVLAIIAALGSPFPLISVRCAVDSHHTSNASIRLVWPKTETGGIVKGLRREVLQESAENACIVLNNGSPSVGMVLEARLPMTPQLMAAVLASAQQRTSGDVEIQEMVCHMRISWLLMHSLNTLQSSCSIALCSSLLVFSNQSSRDHLNTKLELPGFGTMHATF